MFDLKQSGFPRLMQLKGGALKVFLCLADLMRGRNMLWIEREEREYISKVTGLTDGRVKALLSQIIKADLIRRFSRGYYMVNPYIAIVHGASMKDMERWILKRGK